MAKSKIELPIKYKIKPNTPKKYHKHEGKPKISYSFYTSFIDNVYKGDALGGYFLGEWSDGNIFSDFGGGVGEYWEKKTKSEFLSEEDYTHIDRLLPRPKTAKYETEVVIDRGSFIIQGFADQEDEPEEGKLIMTDLKTGNHKDKPLFYASEDYQQTTLYSYCRDLEGYEILDSQVYLLERKGNSADKTKFSKAGNPLWLRLSGEMKTIKTPYSRERAERFLKKMDKTVEEISDYYKFYTKYFK